MHRNEQKFLKLIVPVVIAIFIAMLAFAAIDADAKRNFGAHYTVTSTSYSYCSAGNIMASGKPVYFGAVANNFLPLKTLIKLDRPFHGRNRHGKVVPRRFFRVEDRIGWGSSLDIWTRDCSTAINWGKQTIGFRVVTR